MIIHRMEQGTDEWHKVKCGKISASSMSDVMAKGAGKTRKKYMMKVLSERLSGIPQQGFSSPAMEWGIETEQYALAAYMAATGNDVDRVGFIEIDDLLGCSTDGLIGDDGILEVKCPNTATHLEYMLHGKAPSTYVAQMQSELWMTGRKWCEFVSYDPRLPEDISLFIVRVERDEEKISTIEKEVEAFIAEMLTLEKRIFRK